MKRSFFPSLAAVIIVTFLAQCSSLQNKSIPGTYLDAGAINIEKVLPVPPSNDSLAALADIETVLMVQSWRTPEQAALAKKDAAEDIFHFSAILGPWFSAANLPACDAFFKAVIKDVKSVSDKVKVLHMRKRPPFSDSGVKPCVDIPKSTSYPSGHSTRAFSAAAVLSEIFPEHREALYAYAHRCAWSRIIGGVHFPTDDVGGRLLAEAIFREIKKHPKFRAGVVSCREEADNVRHKKGVKK